MLKGMVSPEEAPAESSCCCDVQKYIRINYLGTNLLSKSQGRKQGEQFRCLSDTI